MSPGKAKTSKASKPKDLSDKDTPTIPTTLAKSIILFSDGTGNSSAKLFKTNVFRLYEAVDLGPAAAGKQRQIAYYDDGVGTSSFRPLALLGGVFGLGLKRNVLDIYSYVCRNYDPSSEPLPGSGIKEAGDHIYGFGFSRGAFTIRLAIAMIADQGIIPYASEQELQWKVEAAYDVFRRFRTRRAIQWFRELFGKTYDPERITRRVKHKTGYDRAQNHRPVIRFIGVWDTVAAYGGPIVEVTRAVDNWFYPLSMPDYKLSKHVRRARHAIALDDERDSFWPLLWDEIAEEDLRKSRPAGFDWIDEDRLRQVWFTGMHSDVGGGYPDESLSFVSLLWMIEEARKSDLRTVDEITERYRALVNSFGPVHDSRAGAGAYYRYQPRKIAAWLDPVRHSTLSLRDPEIRDEKQNARKGLIRRPLIHESAIARIASGTDGYAPIVLPDLLDIDPPGPRGETAPLATTGGPEVKWAKPSPKAVPLLAGEVRSQLDQARVKTGIATSMESAWDLVWQRRAVYFANIGATSALLMWPLFAGRITDANWVGASATGWRMLIGSARELLGHLIRVVAGPLPDFTDRWATAWAGSPLIFLFLVVFIIIMGRASTSLQTRLRDKARSIWHSAVPRIPPASAGQLPAGVRSHVTSKLERFRNSPRFQRALQLLKWSVLPQLAALVMTVVAIWLALAIVTRIAIPFLETGDYFCPPETKSGFETARLCNNTGKVVRAGRDYVITFEVKARWKDGSYETDPEGLTAAKMKWLVGYAGAPFRRVANAAYLRPIAKVRSPATGSGRGEVTIEALDVTPVPGDADRFEARFSPRIDGRLYLFANDSVSLADLDFFYTADGARNEGSASVAVAEADPRPR